jgi:hypothetical protein
MDLVSLGNTLTALVWSFVDLADAAPAVVP